MRQKQRVFSLFLLSPLLAEGVDRNHTYTEPYKPTDVALLAEGVDRNFLHR